LFSDFWLAGFFVFFLIESSFILGNFNKDGGKSKIIFPFPMNSFKKRKFHLAVSTHLPYPCGQLFALQPLVAELFKKGFRITLISQVTEKTRPWVNNFAGASRLLPLRQGASLIPVMRKLERDAPDAILNATHADQGTQIALQLKKPLFWRLASHPRWWWKNDKGNSQASIRTSVRKIALLADGIIAVSDFVRAPFLRAANGKAETIYEGCDTDFFQPNTEDRAEFRKEFRLADRELAVGIVANITWQKRHAVALAALARLRKKGVQFKCFLVGGAFDRLMQSERHRLMQMVKKLHLSPHVVWTGFRNDRRRVLNGLDVVVFPFLDEGYCLALVEAMACEKSVVVNSSGAFPELVRPGKEGFMVPPEDPARLSEALETLAGSAELRRRLGKNARRTVCQKFSLERQVQGYIRFFNRHLTGDSVRRT
jgi:glycosyltransferase involved in cell wall biosynthesis